MAKRSPSNRATQWARTADALHEAMLEAVATLRDVLGDKAHPSARVAAAKALIEIADQAEQRAEHAAMTLDFDADDAAILDDHEDAEEDG